jgi:hypothetical protein
MPGIFFLSGRGAELRAAIEKLKVEKSAKAVDAKQSCA